MIQRLLFFLAIIATTALKAQNTDLTKGCKNTEEIYVIILEAIDVGAPTYNDGNFEGCYRIYEGAAYKILHLHGSKCKLIKDVFVKALEKAKEDQYNVGQKAWVMRMAFDEILGVPTTTGEKVKRS